MEGDEIEMSEEELQKWIREEVDKSEHIFPHVLEKCKMLQSILKKREKQAAHLLKLCESVESCEAIVKKQYSLLGWEYKDTNSDDGDNITGCGYSPPSPYDSIHSEMQDHHSSETNRPSSLLQNLQYSEHLTSSNGKNSSVSLMREAVVVLTRLPQHKIRALRPSTSQKCCDEDESLSSPDSDIQWEPDSDSCDSDSSFSGSKTGSNKRRKIDEKNKIFAKSGATSPKSSNTEAKRNTVKTSTPQANSNTDAKNSTAKTSSTKTSTNAKKLLPEVNSNGNAKSNKGKMSSPENTNGGTSACISALCQSDEPSKKTPPTVPQGEISVNMHVLARRRELNWQRGQIMEILIKEDGRMKYKVNFEEKGKSLVSGHHIAFDYMPKLEHLVVGSRVVIKCPDNNPPFCPGILAELPSRKNRMRFLVFTDDHKPVYVGLPLLHLVCRPLPEPLNDIPDDAHRNFMKDYLKMWPYPRQTQYKVGQMMNVELNGIQERCEVQAVDCSLMEILFQKCQQKEWIYRGSMRLEHMVNMKENLDVKKNLASTKT